MNLYDKMESIIKDGTNGNADDIFSNETDNKDEDGVDLSLGFDENIFTYSAGDEEGRLKF